MSNIFITFLTLDGPKILGMWHKIILYKRSNKFDVYGSVHRKHIPIYIQQDATLHSLLYLETALHVSGVTSTHHQERVQLYLQHLVFVTPPLLLSAAIVEELQPVWVCCWWRRWRPKSATPPEIIEQVHDMILDDRRMKVREIAETLGHFKSTCRIYFAWDHTELYWKHSFSKYNMRARVWLSQPHSDLYGYRFTGLLVNQAYYKAVYVCNV
jgi:hypothetical protein